VNVAVGTDSLASSPDLSILAELRFLRQRHGNIRASELFSLATTRAASAVGLAGRLGILAPGAWADLAVWPLATGASADDAESILSAVVDSAPAPRAVYVAGQAIRS